MEGVMAMQRAAHPYPLGFMENIIPPRRRMVSGQPDLTIGFVLVPRFTLIAFASFVDALRLAADIGDRSEPRRCRWTIMTADNCAVRSSCGVEVAPWESLRDPRGFHYVAVVGGLVDEDLQFPARLLSYLRRAATLKVPLIGLCTGSFALAASGLLANRVCCVHGYHYELFASLYPGVRTNTEQIFVDAGNVITSAGGTSTIDLAAYLIERHCGRDRALKIQHHAVVDRFRTPQHPQLPLADPYFRIKNMRVRQALFILEQNLRRSISAAAVARTVGCSERQLTRDFVASFGVSPAKHFLQLRLNKAAWLLENTMRPVGEIADECGFSDSSHFARHFREYFGLSPRAKRREHADGLAGTAREIDPSRPLAAKSGLRP
jgi:transcriptional regulator GlxA family with amidase domain